MIPINPLPRLWKLAQGGAFFTGLGVSILFLFGSPNPELPPLKVNVGEKAPDFALATAEGKTVKLSDFAGHNVLIDFYRGYWWPYCNAELGEFVKHYEELKALDVQVVGVSVDPPEKCRVTQEKLKTPFPILSDSQHEAMEAYGTRSPTYKGPGGSAINTPTLILIDKTGTVRWIHQAENYKIRAPISEVLEEAKKLK